MSRRTVLILIFLLTFSSLYSAPASAEKPSFSSSAKTFKFINGQWFDGKRFARRTFYVVTGVLRDKEPNRVDEEIDLKNGYIVPPFGDAHCHNFDNPLNINQQVESYLRDGVFYAKVQTDVRTRAEKVADKVNNPSSVDVSYAHGGLTSSNSHPIMLYESLALGLYNQEELKANAEKIQKSRLRENDAYYIIDSAADLENKWSLILAGKPDFIKVYLLSGDQYGKGIEPQLLPQIVKRAYAVDLRVSVHVNTAANFHTAVMAGVDEIHHLPGFYFEPNEDLQKYEISMSDAKQAAQQGILMVPTAWRGVSAAEEPHRGQIRAFQIRSLSFLKQKGVRFAIGTDYYGMNSLPEAIYLSELGIWSNLEVLKKLSQETPQMIFPQRKIGHLRDGYEASFLVLDRNPLESFENVKSIRGRFKQGKWIQVELNQSRSIGLLGPLIEPWIAS